MILFLACYSCIIILIVSFSNLMLCSLATLSHDLVTFALGSVDLCLFILVELVFPCVCEFCIFVLTLLCRIHALCLNPQLVPSISGIFIFYA